VNALANRVTDGHNTVQKIRLSCGKERMDRP
jgi:hypothetical protein